MSKLIELKNNKTKFEIKNVSKNKAEIIIYDEIGDSWFGGISAKQFTEELNALDDSIKLIDVRINSPGGSVFEGYTIFNRLKQHDAEVNVYIDGMAASIASLIMLAGDKIYMAETAQVMIHKPMAGVWGNANEMLAVIDRLDSIENQLLKNYRNKTGIDIEELRTMVDQETWFTAEQALEMGFVDEIIDQSDEENFAAAASIRDMSKNAKWFKHEPSVNISDKVNQKVNNKLKEIEGFLARKK